MKTETVWLVPALAAAALAQTSSVVTRDGKSWVQTTTGQAAVEGAYLKVVARGAISVQGEARDNIGYTLRIRSRAHGEASAGEEMARIVLKTFHEKGGWNVLQVSVPENSGGWADLHLMAPRSLRKIVIESQGGTIEANDLDGSVHSDSGGGEIQMDRIAGDVMVRTQGGQVRLGKIGGSVKCFSGAGAIMADLIGGQAYLNTAGGEISVRQAKGQIHANTGGGNIRVERADNGVVASTGGGVIDVIQSGGPVTAEAGNGSIKVRSASDVKCQSGMGTIQLQAVYGGLRAATGSGSIVAELLPGKPLQDSFLSTGMGDITVYLPSNLAVTVQAINSSPGARRIISDFAELRPQIEQARSQAQGMINGGGPMLRLTATAGTIYIRRQK
jgi:hypothetical protein